jgi:hypothetical protein
VVIGQNPQGQSLIQTAEGAVYVAEIKPPPAKDTPVIIQTAGKNAPDVGAQVLASPSSNAKQIAATAQVMIYKNEISRDQALKALDKKAVAQNTAPLPVNALKNLPPLAPFKQFDAVIMPRPDAGALRVPFVADGMVGALNGGQNALAMGDELALILNPQLLKASPANNQLFNPLGGMMGQNQTSSPSLAPLGNNLLTALLEAALTAEGAENNNARASMMGEGDGRIGGENKLYASLKSLPQEAVKAEMIASPLHGKGNTKNAEMVLQNQSPIAQGLMAGGATLASDGLDGGFFITGRILSASPQGTVILTADQLIVVSATVNANEVGQSLTLKITPSQISPLTINRQPSLQAMPAFADIETIATAPLATWENLEAFLTSLSALMPSAAQNIKNALPQAGTQFVPAVLFFLTALKGGQLDDWLGNKITTALKVSGKGQAVEALEKDFMQLSKQQQEGADSEWRAVSLPLLHDSQITKIQLFSKSEQDDTAGESAGKIKRFILNFHLSALGAFQLDGRLDARPQHKILDMVVRSDQALPPEMRHEITARYQAALAYTGHEGGLSFQTGGEHFISVLTRAAAKTTNVAI